MIDCNTPLTRHSASHRARVTALALSAGALASPTAAAGKLTEHTTFEFGVFSDYLDTGESLSDNNAVAQGAIAYEHPTGLFAETTLSTREPEEGQEVLSALGYGLAVGDVDLGVAYEYRWLPEHGEENLYEGEIIIDAGWQGLAAEIAYMAAAEDSGDEDSVVYEVGYGFDLADGIGLDAAIGYDDPDDASGDTFWELGVSRAVDVGEISLTYGSRDESDAQDLFVAGYSVSF